MNRRAEFLGEQVAGVAGADGEALLTARRAAVGLAREDGRVRAHQALGPARPDDRHAPGDGRDLLARALGEQDLERERGERARVVVDAAVAFRLPEDGDHVLGAERGRIEESRGFTDVVGSAHADLERLSVHTSILLSDDVRARVPRARGRNRRAAA